MRRLRGRSIQLLNFGHAGDARRQLRNTHGKEWCAIKDRGIAYAIDAAITTGGNSTAQGKCWYDDVSPSLKAGGVHGVVYTNDNNRLAVAYGICSYESNAFKSSNPDSAIYKASTARTLDNNGGNPACNQGGMAIVTNDEVQYRVRRLTPLECERLQGFPCGWTEIGEWTDSKGKLRKTSDAARYKALGNSIALPYWHWMMQNMAKYLPENATLGSLFDGISGFCLIWAEQFGYDAPRWSSEIEEFCVAVATKHFGDEDKGIEGDLKGVIK